MRKISILSLIAVLSATPMMAKADPIPSIGLQGNPAGTITANTNVASTSYVQGAYNDLAGHVNTNIDAINKLNAGSTVEGSVDYKINSAITEVNNTAAALAETVGSHTTAINKLNGNASESGSVDNKIQTKAKDADYTNASMSGVTTISGAIDNLDSRVDAAESAIGTLNGDATQSGSVAYQIASAINSVNAAASDLESRVEDNEDAIGVLNGTAETPGSVANAAATTLQSANAYTDSKRLTVYTTWNSATASSKIALSAATGQ